jgi:hypothetical protein|tara:strand:- start:3926 stop:4543 length:618 start_codon:yes stop_codon:yes gene_type:complete
MANIDAAFGLRPYRILGSGANTNGIATYKIQTSGTAGTSSVIYEGTPVIPLANGLIDIVGAAAGGTVPLIGAFIGCKYTDTNGNVIFANKWPGTSSVKSSTAAECFIANNPDQLFLINCDAAVTQAAVHANANFATGTAGDSTTGISSAELAVSTVATTNTLNLRILGFEDSPSNADVTAAGMLAIVKITNHFYAYSQNGTIAGI